MLETNDTFLIKKKPNMSIKDLFKGLYSQLHIYLSTLKRCDLWIPYFLATWKTGLKKKSRHLIKQFLSSKKKKEPAKIEINTFQLKRTVYMQ